MPRYAATFRWWDPLQHRKPLEELAAWRKLAEAQALSVCSQVRHHDTVRRFLPLSGHPDRVTLLDRVHELGAESADLCVLQPRLSRSLQEYAAVRVLLALQTRAVRPRGARFPSAVPKVRSGLTRWGTHYILSLFLLPPSPFSLSLCFSTLLPESNLYFLARMDDRFDWENYLDDCENVHYRKM